MKALRNNLPVILFILFELAVGVLLLVNPDDFTKAVIICFGVVLIVIGAIYLIRVLRDKSEGISGLTMTISLASLIIGAVCLIFPSFVIGLFALINIFYGAMLIISGIYKIKSYSDARKAGVKLPFVSLLSALLSVVLGVLIIINPFDATKIPWIFIGVSLIFEAALDCVAVILNFDTEDRKRLPEKTDNTENTEE